jgi:hypothetical protein
MVVQRNAYRGGNTPTLRSQREVREARELRALKLEPTSDLTYGDIVHRVRRRQAETGLTVKEILLELNVAPASYYSWRAPERMKSRPTKTDAKKLLQRLDALTRRW